MENRLKVYLLVFFLAFCPALFITAQINPADTIDEEDWMRSQDKSKYTRRNLIQDTKNDKALLPYVLNDTYKPNNEEFSHKYFFDNMYVGGSLGLEKILKEDYVNELTTLTTASIFVGKELTPVHSVRLALAGTAGFMRFPTHKYLRINLKADYLYNLTNKLRGFSSTRRLEISLLGGIGGGYYKMQHVGDGYDVEAHVGMQFKIYTGIFGSIAIEPYVAVNKDGIDFSEHKNWRRFDWSYGITAGYMFYTQDNLSKESRLKLLQHRLDGDVLVDRQSLASWRTPWFMQMSFGGVTGDASEEKSSNGKGNIENLYIGRWMSPVIGVRGGVFTRMTNWSETEKTISNGTVTATYGSHYFGGKIEGLFNPMGLLKNFSWDAPFGGYLFAGITIGEIHKYYPDNEGYLSAAKNFCGGYELGANLWYRLSKDLQVFVEPHYNREYYENCMTSDNTWGTLHMRHHDNSFGVDLGITMLVRTPRYRDFDEMDNVQNFSHQDEEGLSLGVTGGVSILQRRSPDYGHNKPNGILAGFAQYYFNEIHSVRLAAEGLYQNANVIEQGNLVNKKNCLALFSPEYQVNLTNLLSERTRNRTFALEAYIGPTFGTVVKGVHADNDFVYGANFGLKLSRPIFKGISAVLQPNIYVLHNAILPTANALGFGATCQFYYTITAGLQINTNYFIKSISSKINNLKAKYNKFWRGREAAARQKYQYKQNTKMLKRHK